MDKILKKDLKMLKLLDYKVLTYTNNTLLYYIVWCVNQKDNNLLSKLSAFVVSRSPFNSSSYKTMSAPESFTTCSTSEYGWDGDSGTATAFSFHIDSMIVMYVIDGLHKNAILVFPIVELICLALI